MTQHHSTDTIGVILAGGKSSRMGVADKCLLPFRQQPLIEHVIARAKPQVAQLLISANGDPERFCTYNLPIVADIYPEQCGPLAGIISAMTHCSNLLLQPKWLATFPCDAPLAPSDWVTFLKHKAVDRNLDVIVAADSEITHYTFALWSFQSLPQLKSQFANGQRALYKIAQALRSEVVLYNQDSSPFANINTPEDLRRLQREQAS